MKLKIFGATLAIVAGLIVGAHAEPDVTLYQLQERCGKSAQQAFQKEYNGGKLEVNGDQTTTYNYQAHYNPRLNKCFYLEIYSVVDGKAMTTLYRLFDLLENKEYASFWSSTAHDYISCLVQDTKCRSEAEWRQLTKQYLEE